MAFSSSNSRQYQYEAKTENNKDVLVSHFFARVTLWRTLCTQFCTVILLKTFMLLSIFSFDIQEIYSLHPFFLKSETEKSQRQIERESRVNESIEKKKPFWCIVTSISRYGHKSKKRKKTRIFHIYVSIFYFSLSFSYRMTHVQRLQSNEQQQSFLMSSLSRNIFFSFARSFSFFFACFWKGDCKSFQQKLWICFVSFLYIQFLNVIIHTCI